MSALRSIPLILAVLVPGLASAQVNSRSDGSDHYLNVTTDRTLDLSLARPDSAYAPQPDSSSGNGVYDASKWAVIFKYDSVRVSATLGFKNHPSGAPVVWLVKGDVHIDGVVNLSGLSDQGPVISTPGPGGFGGGRGYQSPTTPGSGGLGPGGGVYDPAQYGQGGSYGTSNGGSPTTYGNPKILPVIGGSGGAGRHDATSGGGAGGGAILIVADGTIFLNGYIQADGGYSSYGGSGSGGAIRLVADTLVGTGQLYARGPGSNTTRGLGGDGRIRLEANFFGGFNGGGSPNPITQSGIEAGGAVVFPPSTAPTVRITSINGQPVPEDPQSSFNYGDVNLSATGPVTVVLACTNVPADTARATIRIRVVPKSGTDYAVDAQNPQGNEMASTWTATLPFLPGNGLAALQARAILR